MVHPSYDLPCFKRLNPCLSLALAESSTSACQKSQPHLIVTWSLSLVAFLAKRWLSESAAQLFRHYLHQFCLILCFILFRDTLRIHLGSAINKKSFFNRGAKVFCARKIFNEQKLSLARIQLKFVGNNWVTRILQISKIKCGFLRRAQVM